jgi:hypothetical protein
MNRNGGVVSFTATIMIMIGVASAHAAEPSEPEMRAAVERYLTERNTEPAGSPRYFDATAIALFRKLSCEPADATGKYACRYRIEVGTQYRESRTTTHVFAMKDGLWVSQGPRPAQSAPTPAQ